MPRMLVALVLVAVSSFGMIRSAPLFVVGVMGVLWVQAALKDTQRIRVSPMRASR